MTVAGNLTIRRVMRHALGARVLPPTTSIEYVQADRRRDEHGGFSGYRVRANGRDIYRPNPRTALIKRCDLQKTFLVNFEDREFSEWPIDPLPTEQELRARAESVSAAEPSAPTIRVETETVDTGERREVFGRPARHVITTQRVTPLQEQAARRAIRGGASHGALERRAGSVVVRGAGRIQARRDDSPGTGAAIGGQVDPGEHSNGRAI